MTADCHGPECPEQTGRYVSPTDPSDEWKRRAEEAEAKFAAEIVRTDALVAALPKCDNHPDRPATMALEGGAFRWCDECGPIYPADLPYAAPLRAILAARKGKP